MDEVRPQPFLYVPAISNVVPTENGTDTKNVLKLNRALRFVFSIQSSAYRATYYCSEISLFSTSHLRWNRRGRWRQWCLHEVVSDTTTQPHPFAKASMKTCTDDLDG